MYQFPSPHARSKELALVTLDEQVNSETQSVREAFALPIILRFCMTLKIDL